MSTTRVTITYDQQPCTRCGGSGHYSFNLMHGTRCFGCSGRTTAFTKAGKKAQLAVAAFIAEHFSVRAGDLQVGDRIKLDGAVRTITAVTHEGITGSSTTNGVTVPVAYVTLEWDRPVASAWGGYARLSTPTTTPMQKAVTGADWDQVVAFARTLKRGLVITEQVPA